MAAHKKSSHSFWLTVILIAVVLVLIGFLVKKFYQEGTAHYQTYTGTLPCADCSGIKTTLTLRAGSTVSDAGVYSLQQVYEGKNVEPYTQKGTWKITMGNSDDPYSTILNLYTNDPKQTTYYRVINQKRLQMLDNNKRPINAPFTLQLVASKEYPASDSMIANPASVNCTEKGGTTVMQKRGDGGTYGLCQFPDNRACEEWALYRGECPIGGVKTTGYTTESQKYCAWVGGHTLAQPNATCTLPKGNVCPNDALYNDTCQ